MLFRSRLFRSSRVRWGAGALIALGVLLLLSGCGDNSATTLDPKGPIALRESNISWGIFGLAAIIWALVTGALLYSVFRYRARAGQSAHPAQIAGNTRVEIAWTIAPAAVLLILLVITIGNMFALAEPSGHNMSIRAFGHQWWWEFDYLDNNGNVMFVTADEMHIPVGQPVHIEEESDNVIHSFWVPELGGKTDDIPGHHNTQWLQADKAGNYRGECAEFCGVQHARMDFVVVAEDTGTFATWEQAQMQPQTPGAANSAAANGYAVFQKYGCTGCHAINGVSPSGAKGLIGPNLTHFGSRQLIAGGVLDNTPDNLARWVQHAQQVKEGSDMPSFDGTPGSRQPTMTPEDTQTLVTYLESLK